MCLINNQKNIKKIVFIIDDDEKYLKMISDILKNQNKQNIFDVHTYTNGYDAMKDIEIYNPSLIILDNDMPAISGLEIYKQFQYKLTHIKILVITSNITAIESFKNLGIRDFLIKPFSLQSFLQMV